MTASKLSAAAAALLLSACASEPGWTGTGATPFDSAEARCQIETQQVEGEAFERCMEALGWRRSSSGAGLTETDS